MIYEEARSLARAGPCAGPGRRLLETQEEKEHADANPAPTAVRCVAQDVSSAHLQSRLLGHREEEEREKKEEKKKEKKTPPATSPSPATSSHSFLPQD